MLVVGVNNKINVRNPHKQQSNVPLALPEGQKFVFLLVSGDKSREKKKRKTAEGKERKKMHMIVFQFAIMRPGIYSLVCCHGEFFLCAI